MAETTLMDESQASHAHGFQSPGLRARQRPGASRAPAVDVKRALIEAALRVLARDGISASQRSILKESGVLHQSAIQYYFSGKEGLIRAVLADVAPALRERQLAALAEVPTNDASRDLIRSLLRAFATPHFQLMLSARGKDTAQFIARLQSEYGHTGQRFLFEEFGICIERIVALAQLALPEKPLPLLRLHVLMATTNIFHGVVEISILDVAPFETLHLEPQSAYELRSGFYDYLAAGVTAEPHKRSSLDVEKSTSRHPAKGKMAKRGVSKPQRDQRT